MSAYMIFTRIKTLDAQEMATYSKEVPATIAGQEVKILARYGAHEDLEGAPTESTIILEFPSAAAAKAWYSSPGYQQVAQHRFKVADYRVRWLQESEKGQFAKHRTGVRFQCSELKGLAGRADEIAQDGDVRAVSSDAPGIHGESQAFRHIQIHAGIVQFGQAETCRGQDAVKPRRVDGPWRTVALPRAARQFVKLLPIAFVPRIHRLVQSVIPHLDASRGI